MPGLEKDLAEFSADSFGGRYPGSAGDKRALDFVSQRFADYGLQPGVGSSYRQPFAWDGRETANVIGVLPGSDPELQDEIIVVGGHHDHVGDTSNHQCGNRGGNICNGADDNGSGVIATLHAAKALAKLEGTNRRTLVFVAIGAEEQGLVDSCHYVNSDPILPISDTVFMINLDMIGHSVAGSISAIGASTSTMAWPLLQTVATKHGATPQFQYSSGGSDHACFFQKNVAGVALFSGFHECYHKTCDTVDRINFETYRNNTRTVTEFLWELAQADQIPRFNQKAADPNKKRVRGEAFIDHEGGRTAEELHELLVKQR